MGLRLLPQMRVGLGPDGLRVGAAQNDAAPALQLLAVAGVEDFVVFPGIG